MEEGMRVGERGQNKGREGTQDWELTVFWSQDCFGWLSLMPKVQPGH